MKLFNRQLASYIALSLLIVDAFAVSLHSHFFFLLFVVGFLVNQPGVFLVFGITLVFPSLRDSAVFLSFASCILSAAFWSVIFGFVFRSKLPPNTALEPTPHSRCGLASEHSDLREPQVRGGSAFVR